MRFAKVVAFLAALMIGLPVILGYYAERKNEETLRNISSYGEKDKIESKLDAQGFQTSNFILSQGKFFSQKSGRKTPSPSAYFRHKEEVDESCDPHRCVLSVSTKYEKPLLLRGKMWHIHSYIWIYESNLLIHSINDSMRWVGGL